MLCHIIYNAESLVVQRSRGLSQSLSQNTYTCSLNSSALIKSEEFVSIKKSQSAMHTPMYFFFLVSTDLSNLVYFVFCIFTSGSIALKLGLHRMTPGSRLG